MAMAIVGIAGCSQGQPRAVGLRPITVRVVDATTKQPVADVQVAYALHTMVSRAGFLGLLPSPNPSIGQRLAYRARALTDRNGEATFHVTSLGLRADERLDDEVVLVNLAIDASSADARAWLSTLESRCRDVPKTCGGPPDDVEVAIEMARSDSASAAYRNPLASHAGKLLVVEPGAPQAGFADWTGPDARFAVQFHFSGRSGPETVTVELGAARRREGAR